MIKLLPSWLRRRPPPAPLEPATQIEARRDDITAPEVETISGGEALSGVETGSEIAVSLSGAGPTQEDRAEQIGPTLASLLAGQGVSARLEAMLSSTKLGSMTVLDYVRDPDAVMVWMLQQQNCGRKTANELSTLIGTLPLPETSAPEQLSEPPLPDVRLANLLSADHLSARLSEVLQTTKLGTMGLPEYIAERYPVERWMMQLPNCGRRSVTELRGLIGMHVREMLEGASVEPKDFGSDFADFVAAAPARKPDMAGPPAEFDLRTLVEWHLGRLPERTSEVIACRFGLKGGGAMTLAEIGEDHGVTRERIRQVEAKGLKAMKAACVRFPVRPLVDEATPLLLERVLDGAGHGTSVQVDRRLSAIDGWHELAMLLSHGGASNWLATSATPLGDGWLSPGVDPAAVKAAASTLHSRAAGRPFPRSADALCAGVDPALAAAAMDLILGWHMEAGYAFAKRPGSRLRRTARLHALLTTVGEPLEMVPLLHRYLAVAPRDRCTDRDLVIVMEGSPHLFLEIHEGCWTAIGQAATPPSPEPPAEETADQAPIAEEREEGTNATALERELERVGPCRMGELMNRAIDILPEGRSRHSVGPTLLSNPARFVRVLPGVYALPHQVLDGRDLVHAGAVGYLLNATQARFYAVGRKAGERWGAYPLWTPTAEMRLCRWARAGDDRQLYRSLLDVASIDDWPTDEADRDAWRDLKIRDGRYELWSERRPAGSRPPIDRVLAAAVRLYGRGSIGWVAANRIMGYVPSSYAGAGLLAGMVSAGMAVEQDAEFAWQLPHLPGPSLIDWVGNLVAALHGTGTIEWNEGAGLELSRAFSDTFDGTGGPADQPEEMDEYELIMAEHRQSMQARRLEAQLELEAE